MRARTDVFSGLVWLCIASSLLSHHLAAAQETATPPVADVGQFYPLLQNHAARSNTLQSYLARDATSRGDADQALSLNAVETISSAFMGMTVDCAKCHDQFWVEGYLGRRLP